MADSDSSSLKRLVIACGGTGGHLFPGIAVAQEWRKRGGEVLLLISEKQIDTLATEGHDDLRFERLKSIGMPRITSPKMIGFGFQFLQGLFQCRKILKDFRADAVLGMGGFTSTAPLMAGWLKRLPTFIHESNAIPGRANKLNAKFARTVLVGFERCAKHFGDAKRTAVVGTPLRAAVEEKPDREAGLQHFDLRADRKTLMVMGGSQGARRINELIVEALPQLPADRVQVLLITGPLDYDTVAPAFEKADVGGTVVPFTSEIQFAYAAADLGICRSGASSLTELSHYGLPSILIPYPFAADDHQMRNAEIFSDPGAALLWPQDELEDGETFGSRLVALLDDEAKLGEMHEAMAALAVPDASARICREISGKQQPVT